MHRVAGKERFWSIAAEAFLAAAVVVTASTGCLPSTSADPCGFGERQGLGGCAPVDHLHVNLDERLQELNGSSRRGIGANACTFHAFPLTAVLEDESCSAYVFSGEVAQEAFEGNAGGIIAALGDPVQMAPAEGQGCYATDLFPSRSDLFVPGERIVVAGLGGEDFPSFEVELSAPETLAVDTPTSVSRSASFAFEWLASDANVLVTLVAAYDAEADESTNVACAFDDTAGAAEISADLMGLLQGGAEVADLYFYRQVWSHTEPDDAEVAIDVVATSSVTKRVTLEP